MEQKDLVEALAAHADTLNTAGATAASDLLTSESEQGLKELFGLAGRVRRALAPVRAPAAYRRKLENDLTEVARQRMRGEVQVAQSAARPEWIIGAAVALVGGIAYLLHTRNREGHDLPTTVGQRPA